MTSQKENHRNRLDDFGESIANLTVRGFFYELLEILSNLGEDVEIGTSPVDIRAELFGKTLCRVVPYRELIHLHVGDDPVWEIRVRNETGHLEAVDRILEVYLAVVAASGPDPSRVSRISVVSR